MEEERICREVIVNEKLHEVKSFMKNYQLLSYKKSWLFVEPEDL